MNLKSSIFLFSVLLFSLFQTSGQQLLPKYEAGLNAGVIVYQGDLTPEATGSYKTIKPVFSIFGSRILNNSFAVRLSLMHGKLKGDESKYSVPSWRQLRNFNFTSPVTEISGSMIWHIRGLTPNEAGIINFSPYLFAGAGISFLKITRDWSQFNYGHFSAEPNIINGLNADINQTPPGRILVFPLGAGVRLGVTPKISISMETTYRLTSTDYMDGFSQAANPNKADNYHTTTLGIIYSFGKRSTLDCPPAKN